MHDFTKEELKELLYGLWCHAKFTGKINNQKLYNKIKSMMDNYCDHEWISYPNDYAAMPYCKKCRMAG
jgi:hypothetical protein